MVVKMLQKLNTKNWHYNKAKMQVSSEMRDFSRHLKDNFWTLTISTFGLAIALMWTDVVRTIIDELYPNRSTLYIKFYVAIVVTLISVSATYVISKLTKKNGTYVIK